MEPLFISEEPRPPLPSTPSIIPGVEALLFSEDEDHDEPSKSLHQGLRNPSFKQCFVRIANTYGRKTHKKGSLAVFGNASEPDTHSIRVLTIGNQYYSLLDSVLHD